MKVLQVVNNFGGGVASVAVASMRGCLEIGIDSQVFGVGTPAASKYLLGDFSEETRRNIKLFPPTLHPSLGFSRTLEKTLLSEPTEYNVLHHHGCWLPVGRASLKWKRKFERPLVLSLHGALRSFAVGRSSLKKNLVLKMYQQAIFEKADCITVNSELEAKEARNYGLKNPLAILENGMKTPFNEFTPVFDSKKRVGVFISRLHPTKGIDLLIDAVLLLPKVKRERLKLRLVGPGDSEYLDHLKKRIEREEISEVIELTGPCYSDEKWKAYRDSHFMILPSYTEGHPMGTIEALSASRPIIITQAAQSMKSLVENNAGEWIAIEAKALAEAIDKYIEMPIAELEQLSRNAYDLYHARYTEKKMAENLELIYRWLLKENNRPEFVYAK